MRYGGDDKIGNVNENMRMLKGMVHHISTTRVPVLINKIMILIFVNLITETLNVLQLSHQPVELLLYVAAELGCLIHSSTCHLCGGVACCCGCCDACAARREGEEEMVWHSLAYDHLVSSPQCNKLSIRVTGWPV